MHGDAERLEYLEFALQHAGRQPVLGDGPAQHAADFGQRLKDFDSVAQAGQLVGGAQAGRAASDHCHCLAECLTARGKAGGRATAVTGHALDGVDGQGAVMAAAVAVALARMRTDAPQRGRKRMLLVEHVGGGLPLALRRQRHQTLDVVAGRAGFRAGRQAVLVAWHPRCIQRSNGTGGTRARTMAHLHGKGCLARTQAFVLCHAGVARQDNGDAALLGTAVRQSVQQHAMKAGQVVGIGVHQVVDAATSDQGFELNDSPAVAIGSFAGLGGGLHAGHAGGAVVQHQEDKTGTVVDRVFQSRCPGVKEGAIADGGENRRCLAVLGVGVIEARRHRDRRSHVVHGVNRTLVQPQCVAADVAREEGVRKSAPQGVKRGAVAAARAEGRATHRQFQRCDGLQHAVGGALMGDQPGLAGGRDQMFFDHLGGQFAVRRNMPAQTSPDRQRQPDLEFDRGVGFLKHDESLAAAGKILDQSPWQRISGGDLENRTLLGQPQRRQQIIEVGIADAGRNDAQWRPRQARSRWEESLIAGPVLELFFNRHQFLVEFLVQLQPGARRRRPTLRILLEIGAPASGLHRPALDRLIRVTDAHRGSQQHRYLMTFGQFEGERDHVPGFLRRARVERRDFGEQREQTRVLLGLRGVQSGVIGNDQHQTAHHADIRGGERRVGRHVEPHLFHRDSSTLAGIGGRQRRLECDLLIG